MTTSEVNEVQSGGEENPKAQAFAVLIDSVKALGEAGRAPTASEVRLDLKSRTYGGFSPRLLGYKRFRDFLADAQRNGHVSLDTDRPGDISVAIPGAEMLQEVDKPRIRPDLWKAFVDWKPDLLRLYDFDKDHAVLIPSSPAPLEPERFRAIREKLRVSPDSLVKIEPISMRTQLGWMREFSAEVADPRIKSLLDAALSADKPAKTFVAVLRQVPPELGRWRKNLGALVRSEVERWQNSTPRAKSICIDHLDEVTVGGAPEHRAQSRPPAATGENLLDLASHLATVGFSSSKIYGGAFGGSLFQGNSTQQDSVVNLRFRLHAAIDRMPLEELRLLRIPVGYLFEG